MGNAQFSSRSSEAKGTAGNIAGAITVDLHQGDVPSDITYASEWLAAEQVAATFFIPTAMLAESRYAERLRELPALGHEVASHTHLHDVNESDALITGDRSRLGFLATSRTIHEDFFGTAPTSFRSPGWCVLAPAALDELQRLGYRVDSSATPQRLSVFGSTPFRGAWTLAPRRPHYIRPHLLEIPTSAALVPAGSPTFQIFRRRASTAFVRLLALEAQLLQDRVVVLQFHPDDLSPSSPQSRACPPRMTPGEFLLRRQGGFGFKHRLKDTDRSRISAVAQELVRFVAAQRCATLAALAAQIPAIPRRRREFRLDDALDPT